MTPDQLRSLAMGLPGVTEKETWGKPTFRVAGRLWLTLAPDGSSAVVRSSRHEQQALVSADPATFAVAPYAGRHGWIAVRLGLVDDEQMEELVVEAWQRTAPGRGVPHAGRGSRLGGSRGRLDRGDLDMAGASRAPAAPGWGQAFSVAP